jgi:hypothetical protein
MKTSHEDRLAFLRVSVTYSSEKKSVPNKRYKEKRNTWPQHVSCKYRGFQNDHSKRTLLIQFRILFDDCLVIAWVRP